MSAPAPSRSRAAKADRSPPAVRKQRDDRQDRADRQDRGDRQDRQDRGDRSPPAARRDRAEQAPAVAPRPSRAELQEKDKVWLGRVQLEVYRVLNLFITDRDIVVKFLDQEAMRVWALAFTHESRSFERNYDELEFLGDAVLKATFAAWVVRNYPDEKKGAYTNAISYYMSKSFQPVIARRLKFDELVRMSQHARSNLKIETDLFEAFTGALFTIGNRAIEPNYGYALVGVFLDWVMKDVPFDIKREDPHTLVEQYFNRLGWGKPAQEIEKVGGKHRVRVRLTDRSLERLAALGINGVPAVVGVGESWTKEGAKRIAWEEARKLLDTFGITKKWSVKLKRELFWAKPRVAALRDAVMARAAEYGFEAVKFTDIKKETTQGEGTVSHLLGIYPDGEREIITNRYINARDPESIDAAVYEMLSEFAEHGIEE